MKKYLNLAINFGVYFLLILSVYWGGLLAWFSFWEFYKSFRVSPNFFEAVFGLLGLVAWLNAWYYFSKIRKQGVVFLWVKFYNAQKNKFYFTIIGTIIFIVVFKLAQQGVIVLDSIIGTVFHFLSLPWAFGENIIFKISLNIRRYAPALNVINQLGWLMSLAFEIVLFYYLSRIVFWRPKNKKSANKGNKNDNIDDSFTDSQKGV